MMIMMLLVVLLKNPKKNELISYKYGKKEPIVHFDLDQDEAWYYTI